MSRFIQLHLLTSYPPANLNRDDLGRPKTAFMGGAQRLRISSQSLKRAWRTSDLFQEAMAGHLGTRTRRMGQKIYNRLVEKGVTEKKAAKWAGEMAGKFGALESKDSYLIKQLAHFSPEEEAVLLDLADTLAQRGEGPTDDDLKLLRKDHTAVDIALFGRMLADATRFNTEASVQVAHALSVHEAAVEQDYFSAVDDLNKGEEDVGAGHINEAEFGAGLFYLYICMDRRLLELNLSTADGLAAKACRALAEAAAMVAPTGKQNSYASRACASYIMAEKGDQQPRSLAAAFLNPVRCKNMFPDAVKALEEFQDKMDRAYGQCASAREIMNVPGEQGDLETILRFVEEG